jgi:predicted nucleic-acid-binding protein
VSLDTNVLLRLALDDDPGQSSRARALVDRTERDGGTMLILPEVLVEAVWVLESVYALQRPDVAAFLEAVLATRSFRFQDEYALRSAAFRYADAGDFADHLIAERSRLAGAKRLASFDRKLGRLYPGFVFEP